jgi:secondary thiamine-phosphate synthase enzyme
MWLQRKLRLKPRSRGFHLITAEIEAQLPELDNLRVGLLHLFIQHSSASLSLNENADPSVRRDMEQFFRRNVPDNAPYFEHTLEGPDDMTAHIKSVMIGASVSLPISDGRLALGTWQGIYLGEHREHAGSRSIIATIQGE